MKSIEKTYVDAKIEVDDEFKDVFSHFYFVKNISDESITKTLFPSYQNILIFSFGREILIKTHNNEKLIFDKYLILGPIKDAFEYVLPKDSDIFVVNFKDDGFHRFFQNSFATYENCFILLWDTLNEFKDSTQRVKKFLDFCRPYVKQRHHIAQQIANCEPIKAIAQKNHKTQRSIQINHKKIFGYSSKEIARYQRFLKAIRYTDQLLADGLSVDWLDVVFECGYYDQSHLIHDFKHYLGLSPTRYLKNQQNICNPRL